MNKFVLSLMVATTLSGVAVRGAGAQATNPAVVEVPPTSNEEIENAVAPQAPNAVVEQALPQPGLAESARLSPSVIDAWLANPDSLVTSYPSGGPAMIQYVTLVAGSDARTVVPLITVAGKPNATVPHVRSIAYGLGGAVKAAQETSPDYAAYVLLKVASSGNERLINFFAEALRGDGDIETAELPGSVSGALGPTGGSPGSVAGDGSVGESGISSGSSVVGVSAAGFPMGGGGTGGGGQIDDVSPVIIQ